jgi:hypothetical protein
MTEDNSSSGHRQQASAKRKKNVLSETYPCPRQAAIRSENLGKRKARKEEQ